MAYAVSGNRAAGARVASAVPGQDGRIAMQDVIVALYEEHATAVNVRTELVKDGFATDRVELTSPHEHLQAAKGPAEGFKAQVMDYFRTLSTDEAGIQKLNELAQA